MTQLMLTDRQQAWQLARFAREFINPDSVCVEVGVLYGDHADAIIRERKPKRLTLVDDWQLDPKFHELMNGRDGDDVYRIVCDKFKDIDIVDIERRCSIEQAQRTRDGSVDWVYIDADHAYESIKADIDVWLHKVKVGGFLTGHDYLYEYGDYPVHRAVDEFWQNSTCFKPVAFSNDWVLQRVM